MHLTDIDSINQLLKVTIRQYFMCPFCLETFPKLLIEHAFSRDDHSRSSSALVLTFLKLTVDNTSNTYMHNLEVYDTIERDR